MEDPEVPDYVFSLREGDYLFPPVQYAQEDGLLAFSPDLDPERVLAGYRQGVFPWFEEDEHFFWFAPLERMLLLPGDLHISHSMRSLINKGTFRVTFDEAFEEVMKACSEVPRPGQDGTWITPAFIDTYCQLHEYGLTHSVEVWEDEELVGGLYGLSLGRTFFGESMFSKRSNASKLAFITLALTCFNRLQFEFIDCQVYNDHLSSLGARKRFRGEYMQRLDAAMQHPTLRGKWSFHSNT